MEENKKLKKASEIIASRNQLLFVAFLLLVFTVVFGIVSLFVTANESVFMVVAVLLIFAMAGKSLLLSADGICPWCGNAFLYKDKDAKEMLNDGLSWLVRKKCAHCGMPN